MSRAILALALVAAASPAWPQPLPTRAELLAVAGSDTVYFGPDSYALDPSARATLAAQARLFIANPALTATIEGHSDPGDTRDHALAAAERRASVVRNFLVSMGVEADRLKVVSWGKERPATAASGPAAWALSRRVVTVLARPEQPAAPQPLAPIEEPSG